MKRQHINSVVAVVCCIAVVGIATSVIVSALRSRQSPGGPRLQPAGIEETSNQLLLTLKGHDGWVTSVAFSPDGKWLASGGNDHVVKIWDVSDAK